MSIQNMARRASEPAVVDRVERIACWIVGTGLIATLTGGVCQIIRLGSGS